MTRRRIFQIHVFTQFDKPPVIRVYRQNANGQSFNHDYDFYRHQARITPALEGMRWERLGDASKDPYAVITRYYAEPL